MNQIIQQRPHNLPDRANPDPALAYAIESHHRQLVYRGGRRVRTYGILPHEIERMKDRLAEVRRLLMGTTGQVQRDEIGAALGRLFSGFNQSERMEPKRVIATYVAKLAELPAWAVLAAIYEAERGRIEGMSPDYPPSTTRLHQIAETKLAPLRKEAHQINDVLTATVDLEPVRSPQEIERVARAAADYTAQRKRESAGDVAALADERAEKERLQREVSDRRLLEEYRAQGIEPVISNGRPVSLSLLRSLNAPSYGLGLPPQPKCEFTPE